MSSPITRRRESIITGGGLHAHLALFSLYFSIFFAVVPSHLVFVPAMWNAQYNEIGSRWFAGRDFAPILFFDTAILIKRRERERGGSVTTRYAFWLRACNYVKLVKGLKSINWLLFKCRQDSLVAYSIGCQVPSPFSLAIRAKPFPDGNRFQFVLRRQSTRIRQVAGEFLFLYYYCKRYTERNRSSPTARKTYRIRAIKIL